jgi:hypothetical protein
MSARFTFLDTVNRMADLLDAVRESPRDLEVGDILAVRALANELAVSADEALDEE